MKSRLLGIVPLAAAAAILTCTGAGAQMYPPAPASAPTLPDAVKINAGALTDSAGLTLYVFDGDTDAGKSACNGTCAQNWPPLLAAAGAASAGDFTIVTRDDGTKQWAYKGKPLYRWKGDKAPGDTSGDGVAGKWHITKA